MVSRPSSNMSIGFEKNRDKDGFFNCKDCQRRFATKTAYAIHSRIQHKESGIQVEQLQELPRVEITLQQNTGFEEKNTKCSLFFGSKIDLQSPTRNDNHKLTPHQFSDCKKSFGYGESLKKQNDHEGSAAVCQECKKSFGRKTSLQTYSP